MSRQDASGSARRGDGPADGETAIRAAVTMDLQLFNVDLPRGLAVVRKGKGGKGRMVAFGPQTAAALDRYIRARRTHPSPAGKHYG